MPSELAGQWALDPAIAFLNHGSFGACPRAVLDAQDRYRDRMEAQPVQFLGFAVGERGKTSFSLGRAPPLQQSALRDRLDDRERFRLEFHG